MPSVSEAILRKQPIWRDAMHTSDAFIGGRFTVFEALTILIKLTCFLLLLKALNLVAFLGIRPVFEA